MSWHNCPSPPVSPLPWRFITALTERSLTSSSKCLEGCISQLGSSAVSNLQWSHMQCLDRCAFMPVFQSDCYETSWLAYLPVPSTSPLGWKSFIWAAQSTFVSRLVSIELCLQTRINRRELSCKIMLINLGFFYNKGTLFDMKTHLVESPNLLHKILHLWNWISNNHNIAQVEIRKINLLDEKKKHLC